MIPGTSNFRLKNGIFKNSLNVENSVFLKFTFLRYLVWLSSFLFLFSEISFSFFLFHFPPSLLLSFYIFLSFSFFPFLPLHFFFFFFFFFYLTRDTTSIRSSVPSPPSRNTLSASNESYPCLVDDPSVNLGLTPADGNGCFLNAGIHLFELWSQIREGKRTESGVGWRAPSHRLDRMFKGLERPLRCPDFNGVKGRLQTIRSSDRFGKF